FLNKFNSLFGINPDIKTENQVDSNNVHAEVPVVKIEKQQACTDYMLLDKSLKHLEFISQFESYLDTKNSEKFPAEFLQEFENIKREAQIATIKTTQQLNHSLALAA
ncbi:MAG: hypothetical protein KJO96_11095, partial [Winogradskyella sp.]|nr:hypothetical protein [Winogradskyella sp.]